MRYTYNIKVRDIVKFFVMRFDLATGTKPMFEEEPSRTKRVIMHGSDDMS